MILATTFPVVGPWLPENTVPTVVPPKHGTIKTFPSAEREMCSTLADPTGGSKHALSVVLSTVGRAIDEKSEPSTRLTSSMEIELKPEPAATRSNATAISGVKIAFLKVC